MHSHGLETALGTPRTIPDLSYAASKLRTYDGHGPTKRSAFSLRRIGRVRTAADLSEADRKLLEQGLAKVREDGAQVEVLEGEDAVETIVRYARSHGVTQIFVGHSVERISERECSEALSAAWSGLREASNVRVFLSLEIASPIMSHQKRRGHLKIYLGYAAGVGKTYQMLQDAHELKRAEWTWCSLF